MKNIKLSLLAVCLLGASVQLFAGKPEQESVWYEGNMLTMVVVNEHVVGVDRESVEDIANPLFAFGTEEDPLQADVITVAPGEAGYSPWWELYQVNVLDGRDVSTDPFTSADEIMEAAEAGTVEIVETDFFFLCQILFGGG